MSCRPSAALSGRPTIHPNSTPAHPKANPNQVALTPMFVIGNALSVVISS